MRIRPLTPADYAAVLALNETATGLVDPLGLDRLDWLRLIAAHAVVVEQDTRPIGFVLTFTPGSAFDGLEFNWFTTTYADRFLYIDRIVIDAAFRRQGVATAVYRAIERAAHPFDRAVTHHRTHTPDPAAQAFHQSRAYTPLTTHHRPDATEVTLLSKDLV
ncbi:GNAT family N-acetyltransferase [Kribbella sandramycini]|uniref:GNAT family N-acetyltransferase n=1 Tax=Kribbella sandramycini TaxID=60450 RepID=A0A7Y4L128_9ACTN|nr:putative GNAT superfamily acetyltransferase [Kribbella sandramycini]NOL41501.1 GNAT family N-acetyltransferase [Kribbella sandramycini]